MEQEKTPQENKRPGFLYPLNIWALSFGGIIGWGAFMMPGTMFLPNAGPIGTIIAMALGGLIMLVIGKNFSVLAQRFPDNGGLYAFTRNVLGYDHGFLSAWALGLAYLSLIWANATAFVLLTRYLFGDVLQWGFHYTVAGFDVFLGEILITWVILIAFGLLSYYGGRLKRHLMTGLGLLLLLSVAGLFLGILSGTHHAVFTPAFQPDSSPVLQIFSMLMLAPWMFFGFEAVTNASENFSFDSKYLYLIVACAVVAGCLVYSLLTAISVMDIPDNYSTWTEYINVLHTHTGLESLPVFHSVYDSLGTAGLVLLGAAVLSALSTSLLAFYRAAGYLFCSMAKDRLLPPKYAETNAEGTPQQAFLLVLFLSLPVPFLGRTAIAWLTDVTTISASIVYGYISFCAYLLAREEGRPLGKFLGGAGLVTSIFFFFFPILPNLLLGASLGEESYLLLAAWSLLGFVCYWQVFRKDTSHHLGRSTSMCIMVLFLNFFSTTLWLRHITEQELYLAATEGEKASYSILSIQSLVQLCLIVVILLLMSHIFTTLKQRERQMDLQMVREREISKAKNDLLANISHDIRIPMQSISHYVQMALETCAACYVCTEECGQRVPKSLGDSLNTVEELNQYLFTLISDMQLLERMDHGRIKMKEHITDLRLTMQVLRDIYSLQMQQKQLYFNVDAAKLEDSLVICDEARLSRVLMNLIDNAYDYTPAGGGVMVTLQQKGPRYHQRKTEQGRLAFKTYADYEFRVHDTGQGMDAKEAAEVTAPFEGERTAKELLEKGRGLHIVRNIVQMMNGQLQVVTTPGQGTEVILSLALPLAPK